MSCGSRAVRDDAERADRLAAALLELLTVKAEVGAANATDVTGAPGKPMQQLMDLLRVLLFAELTETAREALVFRRNSIATKLLTCARAFGRQCPRSTLEGPIRAVCDAAMPSDDAGRGADARCRLQSTRRVSPKARWIWRTRPRRTERRCRMPPRCSTQLRLGRRDARAGADICQLVHRLTEERFGEGTPAATAGLSGILFLRVFVPCIAAPSAFAILPSVPPRREPRPPLVSKVVNAVVNATPAPRFRKRRSLSCSHSRAS